MRKMTLPVNYADFIFIQRKYNWFVCSGLIDMSVKLPLITCLVEMILIPFAAAAASNDASANTWTSIL